MLFVEVIYYLFVDTLGIYGVWLYMFIFSLGIIWFFKMIYDLIKLFLSLFEEKQVKKPINWDEND